MNAPPHPFLTKARESLAGAQSEFANSRYNNCANRCYYACFQAAIHALQQAGIQPGNVQAQWGHDFVQAQFVGMLINRRKNYSANLRDVLARALALRRTADYRNDVVSQTQAQRILRSTQEFLSAINSQEST